MRAQRRARWGLLALLLLGYGWFDNQYPGFINPNALAHVYPALALVDDGTLHLDGPWSRYPHMQDRAVRNGHVYSDKTPGQAAMLVPLAAALRLFGVPLEDLRGMVTGLRLLGLALPAVLFWWLLAPWLGRVAGDGDRGAAVVASGALGTAFFVYATQLFSHALVGMLLFAAWMLHRRARPLAAGIVAGYAFTCDYIVLAAVVVLFGMTAAGGRGGLRRAAAFGVGCAVPLALWMAYNHACFGHPLAVAYHFHAQANWQGAYNAGVAGIQPPSARAALGLLFSPARGLLWLSPALALAAWGWWRGVRAPDPQTRGIAGGSLALFLGLFAFTTTTVDWMGGWSVGPRYLAGAVPFLCVGVALALRDDGSRAAAWAAYAFAALSVVGVAAVALASLGFPAYPKAFANPVFSMSLPMVADGAVTLSLLLPGLLQLLGPQLWTAFTLVAVTYVVVRVAGPRGRAAFLVVALAGGVGVLALQAQVGERPEDAPERARVLDTLPRWMGYAPLRVPPTAPPSPGPDRR